MWEAAKVLFTLVFPALSILGGALLLTGGWRLAVVAAGSLALGSTLAVVATYSDCYPNECPAQIVVGTVLLALDGLSLLTSLAAIARRSVWFRRLSGAKDEPPSHSE